MGQPRVSSRRFVGGAVGTTTGGNTSIPTTVAPYRRVHIDPTVLAKASEAARLLNAMQDAAEEATLASRSNPESGAIILGPYTGASQLLDINHTLGRVPVSVTCCRAIGTAWTGYEIAPTTANQLDSSKTIRLQMPASGTFYFRFA